MPDTVSPQVNSTRSRREVTRQSPLKRLVNALKRPFQKSSKTSKKKGNPNIYPLY